MKARGGVEQAADGFDLLAPHMIADPYPALAQLRETAPVVFSERHDSWIVSRYADVREAFKRGELSVALGDELLAQVDAVHPLVRYVRRWMLFSDAPAHTRMRSLVSRAFTPIVVQRLEAAVQGVVDDLVDDLAARGDGDFMADFALPLPAIVIAELFGLPRDDHPRLREWSTAIAAVIHRDLEGERFTAGAEAMNAFADYLRARIAALRARPGQDLLSRLVQAREAGDLLSEEELIGSVMMFLFAGHETTTALLGNGLAALARAGAGVDRLADADLTLAVEEFVRYDGPVRFLVRHVAAPLTLGGVELQPGERLFLSVASANRDASFFNFADELRLGREPNRHLGFGVGIHFCIGANLARLEARLALHALSRRLPSLAVSPDALRWRPVMLMRCPASLPYHIH